MPKLISYNGLQYVVPKWAKYVMHDSTGELYAYETLPEARKGGVWQSKDRWQKIGDVLPDNDIPLGV